MKTQTRWEFTSEKYGAFYVAKNGSKKFNIWWDFNDEMEGGFIEPGKHFDDLLNFFISCGCDVLDFSDLPKHGNFGSIEEVTQYLEGKFGEKIELR